jgi:multidrug efflux pump subunit AcrB
VLLDLRRLFYPYHLWISVGIGSVSEARKRPVNRFAGGQAFERAREGAERLSKGSPKFRILTSFESGAKDFDAIANTVYHLHDTILEGTTAKQWSTINAQMETGSQEATAQKLGVDVSTVSRTLKRGHYWHMIETIETMSAFLQNNF